MRHLSVVGLLAALAVSVSLGTAALAAPGPAPGTDPRLPYFQIETHWPSSPPIPVSVVSGTVNVSNLPAVQNVTGSVNVSNLPFYADGSLRVSTGGPKQPVVYELVPTPINVTCDANSFMAFPTTINANGYSSIAAFMQFTGSGEAGLELHSRWSPDEPFGLVYDNRHGGNTVSYYAAANYHVIWNNVGGDVQGWLRYVCANSGDSGTLTSFRVYLFP